MVKTEAAEGKIFLLLLPIPSAALNLSQTAYSNQRPALIIV